MRRLRAAATPAAFFIGLALICASLIEFARWPYLEGHLEGSDFIDDLAGGWVPDLEYFGDRLSRPFRARDESWPQMGRLIEAGLVVSGATALLGFAAVAMRRRLAGGTILVAGISSGVVLLSLCALDLRLLDGSGHGCGPHPLPLHSPAILATAQGFVAWVSALGGAAWLLSQRQSGVLIRLPALAAVGVALAMVLTTVLYSRGAALDNYLHAIPPERPVFALSFLLVCGVLLSACRPLYSSRFVSALVLSTGCVAAWPAIEIAHDERLEPHRATVSPSQDINTVQLERCRDAELAPVIQVTPNEVMISGEVLGRPDEHTGARVFEKFQEMQSQYAGLRGGEPRPFALTNLQADEATPLVAIRAIIDASARSGTAAVDIVSLRLLPSPVWSRPTVHTHACAARITVADDGQPLSDFADWPSLVRAADRAEGKLRISVK
ncbi:MAG: hypothetical protein Q8L48_35005 [Archangium sp.]|nr:hypothetical protein [Archangium sp.]